MNTELNDLKRQIASLESQKYNVSKLLKVLKDPDFDTYSFIVEASKESEYFKDKQVLKFYDFSTLPQALLSALPGHLEYIDSLLADLRIELDQKKQEFEQQNDTQEQELIKG